MHTDMHVYCDTLRTLVLLKPSSCPIPVPQLSTQQVLLDRAAALEDKEQDAGTPDCARASGNCRTPQGDPPIILAFHSLRVCDNAVISYGAPA